MEVVVLATVEGILVGAVVAVVGSISPLSHGYALSSTLVLDLAGEEASLAYVLVLREVVTKPPARLCQILHLSSWAACSNFTQRPTELFTCRLLRGATPLVGIIAKASGAALAVCVRRDALISTAPFVSLAAVVGSALSSVEEEKQQSFFDQVHPLCDRDCGS